MIIKINVIPDIRVLKLEVEPYYTGLTIKKKIEYFYDFPCDEYTLTYEAVRFKDVCVISDFDVEDGDTMNLINTKYTASGSFPIHYESFSNACGTIYVLPTFTIGDLKQMVFCQTGVPPEQMRLMFEGKILENTLTVSCCNLREDCWVRLLLRLCGS